MAAARRHVSEGGDGRKTRKLKKRYRKVKSTHKRRIHKKAGKNSTLQNRRLIGGSKRQRHSYKKKSKKLRSTRRRRR